MSSRKITCLGCGIIYTSKRHDSDGLKYCTRECCYRHKTENKKPKFCMVSSQECIECGVMFCTRYKRDCCSDECYKKQSRKRTLKYATDKHKTKRTFECKVCGNTSAPKYGSKRQVVCSDECEAEHIRLMKRISKKKRRATKRAAEMVENIVSEIVFDRDLWTCQICGGKVNRKASVPHHKAPTIDHIVPLSVGGNHTMINVQCAHFICNSRKGNRAARDQLRLLP